jgi:hypothetical protein
MFFQQFADENFILNNLHKWYGHDCQISQLSKGSENLNYLIDGQLVVRVLYLAESSPIFSQAFPYLEREVYFVNTLYENKLNPLRYLSFPDGKFIHRLDVKDGSLFFLKYPYLRGDRITFSSSNLSELARKLANIHDFSHRYLTTFERVPFYDDLISSLHFRDFSYNPQLGRIIPAYQTLWQIFQENTENLKSMKSEKRNIFIHNDLHDENLLLCLKEVAILDFGDCRYSLPEEDIGTLFWGILQKVERSKYEEMLDYFFKYYSRPIDKTVCFRYALQRFLDIHLYYLNENLKEAGLIKYQKEKFNKEEAMINFLISKITE